jgi:hypothetical protein
LRVVLDLADAVSADGLLCLLLAQSGVRSLLDTGTRPSG